MQKYINLVEKNRQKILDALEYIWANPETGYREWKTHKYLADAFEAMGYQLTLAGNIPGFYTEVDTGRPGPTVLVIGEMDGLLIPKHPQSDSATGAVHSCGHCCQVSALVGIAAALKEPGALDGLSGKIRLMAVPAEELVEVEFRKELRAKGEIRYLCGKSEFISRGMMDGADLAFMIHTDTCRPHTGSMNGGSNGMLAKSVVFEGVSAHAGGSPHKGINALYAANLALNAINALRETFKDNSHIRVHPIITAGGDSVNAIPDTVRVESYVRGATMDDIAETNKKVNRAIAAAAAAMGAKVRLTDIHGAWPRKTDINLMEVFREAMGTVLEEVRCNPTRWGTGCSDMGDVSSLMPMVHPYVGGATGTEHGIDYYITDPDAACVDAAKVQMVALKLLLENDAARAKAVVEAYVPVFACKEEYMAYVDKLDLDGQAVSYGADGQVTLTYMK